jgi:hypothetical protein
MAEIKVEKKRSSSILPWILGLALVALLIWAFTQLNDRDEDRTTSQGAAVIEMITPAPVDFTDIVRAA